MPQSSHSSDSGEENQDAEEGAFWGLTKSASSHYRQVFLVAMGPATQRIAAPEKQRALLGALTETPPKGRLDRTRRVFSCAAVEWAASR